MLWIDGSQPVRLIFREYAEGDVLPANVSEVVSLSDFTVQDPWVDLVVGSHPRYICDDSSAAIELGVIVRDAIDERLFKETFSLLLLQKLGGILVSHACLARIARLEIDFEDTVAKGRMRISIGSVHRLQDEPVARRAAA